MEWINVKDNLPEINKDVLIFHCSDVDIAFIDEIEDEEPIWFYRDEDCLRADDITHWMPLPKPPEEK